MAGDANVRSIEALKQLNTALKQFGEEASAATGDAGRQLDQTRRHVEQRYAHWQQVTQKMQRSLHAAQTALRRCEATGSYDRDGRYVAPDCSRQRAALKRATRDLKEAQTKLTQVRKVRAEVEQAALEFHRIRAAMGHLAGQSTARASSALQGFTNKLQAYLKTNVGDFGETAALKTLHAMGAVVAGLGLKYGKHGIDAYGLRNTPKGHSLLLVESKATADPRRKGTPAEIRALISKQGKLPQASKAYNDSRLWRARDQRNRVALLMRSKQIRTGVRRIHQTQHYVHWTNVATGQKRMYRIFSNRDGTRVKKIVEVKIPSS